MPSIVLWNFFSLFYYSTCRWSPNKKTNTHLIAPLLCAMLL